MARLNEILVGRFNRSLQKTFGIKGGPPVATLAPEIMPVVPVSVGVERRFLESWNKFGVARNVAANAANTQGIQLANPTNSNIVAVVESVKAGSTAAQQWNVCLVQANPTNLASLISTVNEDGRYGNQFAGVVIASFTPSTTSTLSTISMLATGNGQSVELIETEAQEIPLLPGATLLLTSIVVNLAGFYGFRWRERFLEDSERTG